MLWVILFCYSKMFSLFLAFERLIIMYFCMRFWVPWSFLVSIFHKICEKFSHFFYKYFFQIFFFLWNHNNVYVGLFDDEPHIPQTDECLAVFFFLFFKLFSNILSSDLWIFSFVYLNLLLSSYSKFSFQLFCSSISESCILFLFEFCLCFHQWCWEPDPGSHAGQERPGAQLHVTVLFINYPVKICSSCSHFTTFFTSSLSSLSRYIKVFV